MAPFTSAEARGLFEVIAGLEGLSAELAVSRLPPNELAGLEAAYVEMLERYARRDKDGYFDLNTAIHDAIVRASENRVMVATHAGLTLRTRRGRYMAILDPARWRESVEEHEAVIARLSVLRRALRHRRAVPSWRGPEIAPERHPGRHVMIATLGRTTITNRHTVSLPGTSDPACAVAGDARRSAHAVSPCERLHDGPARSRAPVSRLEAAPGRPASPDRPAKYP